MKALTWIVQTELKQSRLHFVLMTLVSLIFGFTINLGFKAQQRVASLAVKEVWNADLVILPKGLSLEDLRQELLSGSSKSFLPEAIFDTTFSMAQNQFRLGAVLALPGDGVLTRGDKIGIQWLDGRQKIGDWKEQNIYRTAEWGNKVISAFFASGPEGAMKSLKDLIDRKTVAQAIWIKEQTERDQAVQKELLAALWTVSFVFLILIVLLTMLSWFWLKIRLSNSFKVFSEIGITTSIEFKIISCIVFIFILIPIVVGSLSANYL